MDSVSQEDTIMVTASHHAGDTIKSIFISWSKSRSSRVALALQKFLRDLFVQFVDVVMSEDVEIGQSVLETLNKMLREADLVVLCMTSENWNEPWIFYEAGVVFGKADRAIKVCPYVVDLNKKRRKLPGPLWQFKAVKADKDGTLLLVHQINDAIWLRGNPKSGAENRQHPYTTPQLMRVFDVLWPELEKVIKANQPDPADPHLCVEDDSMVRICIAGHQDRLELRLSECIDRALDAVRSDTYDYEQIIDFTWREIEASKERYRGTNSILVGNVADFFGENYSEDDLRRVVKSMEHELANLSGEWDSHTAKDRLLARVRRALREAFKGFHLILSARLRQCLAKKRANSARFRF